MADVTEDPRVQAGADALWNPRDCGCWPEGTIEEGPAGATDDAEFVCVECEHKLDINRHNWKIDGRQEVSLA